MKLSSLIELNNVSKIYKIGAIEQPALKNVNLSVNSGELLAIVGASGSGKSTLMNLIGLLDKPTNGTYSLNGQDMLSVSAKQLAQLRNQMIGFVFQSFFLLSRLNVLQNVSLPLSFREFTEEKMERRAHHILQRVGIDHLSLRKPHELSGGQQQRAAIARALVGRPSVVLADEPTGALDSKTGQEIIDLFINLNENDKNTIIIITHDMKIASQCHRIIQLKDGVII